MSPIGYTGSRGVQGIQGLTPTGASGFAGLMGYTSTATSGGSTTLDNTSTQYQLFTGSASHTVRLPNTSTLTTGWTFHIVNNSTGTLTVNAAPPSLVATVPAQMTLMVTCISTSGSGSTDWEAGFTDFGSVTGTGAAVLATGPTLSGAPLLNNATSGNAAIASDWTFRLPSNGTAIGPTIADFFGATSALSLEATSVYEIRAYCMFAKTTAGTATWTLTASSAPTLVVATYLGSPATGLAAGAVTSGFASAAASLTTAFLATGSLSTGVNHAFQFTIQVITNAATNFRFQLTQSAGTATPANGSYYTVKKISSSTGTFV